jgi:hypothetical protein
MYKPLPLALLVGLFAGCYSSLDSFTHRLTKLSCINAEECQPADFAATYDSLGACVDDVEPTIAEIFAGCSYDAKRGRKCIRATYHRRKDCSLVDSVPSECEAVVFCPESVEIDAASARFLAPGFIAPLADAPPDAVPLD